MNMVALYVTTIGRRSTTCRRTRIVCCGEVIKHIPETLAALRVVRSMGRALAGGAHSPDAEEANQVAAMIVRDVQVHICLLYESTFIPLEHHCNSTRTIYLTRLMYRQSLFDAISAALNVASKWTAFHCIRMRKRYAGS